MVTTTSLTLFIFLLVSTTISVVSTLRNISPATENSGVWCVANRKATDEQLQANIDWCCSEQGGFRNCSSIQPGGDCFEPNTPRDHASYVMNSYYQNLGHTKEQCDFGGTGSVTKHDPSHGACVYENY